MRGFPATIRHKVQFHRGKAVEAFLDEFFRNDGWQIEPTTSYEERVLCLGDRHFARDGFRCLVEYKSGLQTAHTGNVFLETISVDTAHKPGWVYTCRADFIFYAALLNGKILIFRPNRLRAQIDALRRQFREVATCHHQNDGYQTHGLVIPLAFAEEHLASKVLPCAQGD